MITYHLSSAMKILFVGINPHHGSYRRGVPFSNHKMFWYLLSDAGIIPELRTELRDDTRLFDLYTHRFNHLYHLGLINMVDRPTRTIAELRAGEEIQGRQRLETIIKRYHPTVVCFVGKATYRLFAGSGTFTYGWQEKIGSSQIYVMHTPQRGPAVVRIKELQDIARAAQENY